MSRQQGTFKMNGTIEPKVDAPLDARLQVKTKADLTANGSFPYRYRGMIVSVESEEKAYMLIGADPTFITNWKEVGSGGGESGSVELTWEEYQSLSEEEKMNGMTYYIKDGNSFINVGDLVDVKLVNVSNGQVLKFNSTSQKWENANDNGGGGGGSALQSITYNEPILTLTYDDGSTYDFNVRDSILRVTELGDLGNVIDSTIQNTNVLQYDSAIQGYKPYDIVAALTALLNSAKTYTDEEIASSIVADAIYADLKPTCAFDSGQSKYIVSYLQNGVAKTTDATTDRFYYKVDDDVFCTSWFVIGDALVDPVEMTFSVNSVDMDNFIQQTDVISTYNTSMVDKTKIPNIAALDALMTLVSTALGLKANTADIVDDLTHTDTNKPLSANQGKVLKGLVDDLDTKKNDKMQFVEMPTAASEYVDNVYQFVGNTTASFTQGLFYKCVYNSEQSTYSWVAVTSGGGGSDLDVDGTTITKDSDNIISAVTATNGTKGIVKGGEGVSIADDGSINVVSRLVITNTLPEATNTMVGNVRLLTANQTGYRKGGIYQCQVTGTDQYEWVLISFAEVDPTELSNAIANDVQSRNLLIFG